ncbi:hypothetical protein D3C84_523940 [compost metagenome]
MAEAIVDRLEVVEIDQHQRQRLVVALGVGQGRLGALDQVAAVRQLGQRIVEGRMLQGALALAEAHVGRGQFGGAGGDGGLQFVGAGLHLRQACGLLAVGLLQGGGALLLEHLDAISQGEGEEDGLGGDGDGEHVGGEVDRLDDAGGAHHQHSGADQHGAVADQVEARRDEALAPADQRADQGGGHRHDRRQGDQDGALGAVAEDVDQDGHGVEHAGHIEQALGPAQAAAGVQQLLGEAHDEDAPERRQGDAVQPQGHRCIRPEVLEAVPAHAEDEHQRRGGGQHVPEIGGVAQRHQDEQVVEEQRQDHPVDQAEAEVLGGLQFLEIIQLPDLQRERVARRIEAAEVQGQRLRPDFRQLEQHAPVGVVAGFGEG